MERRFVIAETNPYNPWTEIHMKDTITESELKRRLGIAIIGLTKKMADGIIDILLHGDKEQEVYKCEDCGKPMTKAEGGTVFTVCETCWDKHYKKDQPTAWDEWVDKMPDLTKIDYGQINVIKAWLRACPCRR